MRCFATVFLLLVLFVTDLHARHTESAARMAGQVLSAPRFLLTENRGQVTDREGRPRPDIIATGGSGAATVYLTANGIHYQFTKPEYPEAYYPDDRLATDKNAQEDLRRQIRISTARFTVSLEGANPAPRVEKENRVAYTENFYLPYCPDGITGVPSFMRIVMKDVYPGIDWAVYSRDGGLKYDFIVHPGADPARIRLRVSDAQSARIQPDGSLLMKSELGTVRESAPISFADSRPVATSFLQHADGTFGFRIAPYGGGGLVIDPAIKWATYYGMNMITEARGCTTDKEGNVFITGITRSSAGIAAGGYRNSLTSSSSTDCFVVKFDSSGNRIWGTYYGGAGYDIGYSAAADTSGNIYMAGWTDSDTGMTTPGANQTNFGGSLTGGLLVKFSPAGTLLWATYYGRGYRSQTTAFSCSVDRQNNVFLGGYTNADTGIASGGYQNTKGSTGGIYDGFLAKFDSSGTRLWGTYYGGSDFDYCQGMAVDGAGNVYLTGVTVSGSGIATPGAHQSTFSGGGSYDAFIVKFSPAGARRWATYYGTAAHDYAVSCATDTGGNIYMAGNTVSTTAIATGGHQNTFAGVSDAFIVKFDSSGARIWGSYYGGTGNDVGMSCATGPAGEVILSGYTNSTTGISSGGGIQNSYGGGTTDAFLVKFSSNGVRQWASYFGSSGEEYPGACAVDRRQNVYFCGRTVYTNSYIASNGFQNTANSSAINFAFLLKTADTIIAAIRTGAITGSARCAGDSLNVPYTAIGAYNTGNAFVAQLSDSAGSFSAPVTIGTLSGTAASGTISATLPVTAAGGSNYRIRVVSTSPAVIGSSNGTSVSINPRPAQPGLISGNAVTCHSQTESYSIAAVTGATGYTWTLPATWTGSSTTTGITATAGTGSGTVSVTANNSCGPSIAATLPVVAYSYTTPSISISADHPNTKGVYCSGEAAHLTAVDTGQATTRSYQWKVNGIDSGTNAPTFSYMPSDGDTVTCVISITFPCLNTPTAVSNPVVVKVVPLPSPFITRSGGALHAGSGYAAYRWFLNASEIPGAGDSVYTPTANGTYSVEVTDSAGCRGMSAPFTLSGLSVGNAATAQSVPGFYPNPASTIVQLTGKEPAQISVYSPDGRLILHEASARSVDVSALADGVYLIRISGKDGVVVSGKLVKHRR